MTSPIHFLASRSGSPGRANIIGAPLDLTESFRAGTAAAPNQIREMSQSLETYSPRLGLDLEDLELVDRGDLDLAGLDIDSGLRSIEHHFQALLPHGFAILLGGEHTVALAGYRAARAVYPDAVLLQLDAHLDIREEYEGSQVGHATWVNLAGQQFGFDSIIQLGIRSGTRAEFERSRAHCLYSSPDLVLPNRVRQRFAGRPVYLSIDIDVLDPGAAPGTGCPEPGGVTFVALVECLYAMRSLRVVAADICEVLPAVDPAGVSAVSAAKLARELVLMFGAPGQSG